jgi:hypothetical protein
MIAAINTYTDLVTVIDYILSTDDIAAISMADRGESLRMLEDRGVALEPAGKGVTCFRLDGASLAIEIKGSSALVRRMEERDFEEVMLNEMAMG